MLHACSNPKKGLLPKNVTHILVIIRKSESLTMAWAKYLYLAKRPFSSFCNGQKTQVNDYTSSQAKNHIENNNSLLKINTSDHGEQKTQKVKFFGVVGKDTMKHRRCTSL